MKKGNKPSPINPNIKKYLVTQLASQTQNLTNLQNQLTQTNTYIDTLNSQLKFVQNTSDLDKSASQNLKKPTKAEIQKEFGNTLNLITPILRQIVNSLAANG